jgi:hypothetical protein
VGRRYRITVAALVLVLVSCWALCEQQTGSGEPARKNVAVGVLLGAFGGTLLPGSYGWGNLYAGDLVGFLILNLGGSACSLLGSGFVLLYVLTGESLHAGIGGVGGAGAIVFAVASAIWGGIATDRYNKRTSEGRASARKPQVGVCLLPAEGGVDLELTCRY